MRRLPAARRGRLIFMAGALAIAAVAVLAVLRPRALRGVDNATYDVIVRWMRAAPPSDQIVIVDVDERSLTEVGQWPWRRDLVAKLLRQLRDGGAALVALDMIFAEADSHHPAGGRTPDDVLAEELAHGQVVLGYGLTFEEGGRGARHCLLHPIGLVLVQAAAASAHTPYFRATGAVCNLPALAGAASASGFLNAAPDADGILRRVPLVAELNGGVQPSLAVAAVAAYTGTREFGLRVSSVDDSMLMVGDRKVPVDGRSNLLVRFRGKKRTFAYVSAADVMSGAAPRGTLGGRIAFVGATALGTREVVATPLDTLFTGVEVQATVADNLLRQDFVSRPAAGRVAEAAAVLLAGGLVAALFARAGVVAGLAGGALIGVAMWWGAVWQLSAIGTFISPLFPTLGVSSALAAMTLVRFRVERGRADHADRERAAARALMVQSLLSLTEVRDAETGRHSLRTQQYARLLAEQLAADPAFRLYLTPERIDLLASLAPLHDIGKVGIRDQVLNKPGELTPEELAEMRQHPALGREVIVRAEQRVAVKDDETLDLAKDIVYTHHERWDGTGYPQGLRGPDIPVAGRIMALVDVYDACITRTLYKPVLTHDAVTALIAAGRGTHFDPAVVEAFLRIAARFRDVSRSEAAEPV